MTHTFIAVLCMFAAYMTGGYFGSRNGFKEGIDVAMESLVNLGIIQGFDVQVKDIHEDEDEDES